MPNITDKALSSYKKNPCAKAIVSYQKCTVKWYPLVLFSVLDVIQVSKYCFSATTGIYAHKLAISDQKLGFALLGGFFVFITTLLWPFKLASVIGLQQQKAASVVKGCSHNPVFLTVVQVTEILSAVALTAGLTLAIFSAVWAALNPQDPISNATTLATTIDLREFGIDMPDPIAPALPPELFLGGAVLLVVAALLNFIHVCHQKSESKWAKALGISATIAESLVTALVVFMLPNIDAEIAPTKLNAINVGLTSGLVGCGVGFTTFSCLLSKEAKAAKAYTMDEVSNVKYELLEEGKDKASCCEQLRGCFQKGS